MAKRPRYETVPDWVFPTQRDREELYRIIYDHCDRHMILITTHQELQKPMDMGYQAISELFKEFQEMGLIVKEGKSFRLLYRPDQIPWGSVFDDLRKRYRQSILRSENGN